jgi:hypothetical protein
MSHASHLAFAPITHEAPAGPLAIAMIEPPLVACTVPRRGLPRDSQLALAPAWTGLAVRLAPITRAADGKCRAAEGASCLASNPLVVDHARPL